jgi:hypothetical protein
MASATTYNVASNREDILQGFTRLEPERTPILSSAKRGRAPRAAYSEWVVDSLADPSLSTVAEGTDVTSFENPGVDRTRLGNRPQRQDRGWQVSDLEQLVDDAAVESQTAEAKSKTLIEHKLDIDCAIGSDQEMSADNASVIKGRMLGKWIQDSAQAVNPVDALFRPPAASINTTATGSLTEDNVRSVMQSVYETIGDMTNFKLYAGTNLKSRFSDFTRIASTALSANYDTKSTTLNKTVERYVSDWGAIDLVPSLNLAHDSAAAVRSARGYLINPDLLEIAFADGPSHYQLEDKGGGPRGFYKSWWMLRVKNPKGLGKFAATS